MSITEESIEFVKENRHINSLTYQIPASELLDCYWYANKILFSPYLGLSGAVPVPYKDEDESLLYSDTITALLLGLPFPEPIVAEDLGGERFSIISGEQTMSTIIHYLGGMPKFIKRTLSDDVEIFPGLSDLEFGKLSEKQQEELLRGVIVKVELLDPYKLGMDSEDIAKFYGSYKN